MVADKSAVTDKGTASLAEAALLPAPSLMRLGVPGSCGISLAVAPDVAKRSERLSHTDERSILELNIDSHHVLSKQTASRGRDSREEDKSTCSTTVSNSHSITRVLAKAPEGSKVQVFERPIPKELKERFLDFKIQYTRALLHAISKGQKTAYLGDISMKLRYQGTIEDSAQLYIIVQCESRIARRVKQFFAQGHVVRDLNPDFTVQILEKPLIRLSSNTTIEVLASAEKRSTFCGMQVRMKAGHLSSTATIGGLVLVVKDMKEVLYGITAGHPLSTIYWNTSEVATSSDVQVNDDEEHRTYDNSVMALDWNDDETLSQQYDAPHSAMKSIGTVAYDSLSSQSASGNYDWALIDLNSVASILTSPNDPSSTQVQSPSKVLAKDYVKMFLLVMDTNGERSAQLFDWLVATAMANDCEAEERLTAMKLLFRLRADCDNRIFLADDLESGYLAGAMCRSQRPDAEEQAEKVTQTPLPSISDGVQSSIFKGSFLRQRTAGGASLKWLSKGAENIRRKYRQLWSYPDIELSPDANRTLISPILVAQELIIPEVAEGAESTTEQEYQTSALDMSTWLDAILTILKHEGTDWEVQELRRLICEQIHTNGFLEPPAASGLGRGDVALCLFHSLTTILSYHKHFSENDEDEIVKALAYGVNTWERTAKHCIHSLHMAASITRPDVSVDILQFLASLSRAEELYRYFKGSDIRMIFGICFRYLHSHRDNGSPTHGSRVSNLQAASTPDPAKLIQSTSWEVLPQYGHELACQVIVSWFIALKLQDRARHASWIVENLFAARGETTETGDESILILIDFIQRVAYTDANESAEDPSFTEDKFGPIAKKQWLIGNSIVTIKQATASGWAEIVKRQPSGTSAYLIRAVVSALPAHQTGTRIGVSGEGHIQTMVPSTLPSHLLIQLMSPIPQTSQITRPIPLPDNEIVDRAIRVFDRCPSLAQHKIGVVYIRQGQTNEADILANRLGNKDYQEFLDNLGTLMKLNGATFNTQGLDHQSDSDGQHAICWRDQVTEMVFHVTTLMPTDLERDPHCTLKKRHIGNDFVNIFFDNSGLRFNIDTFPTQFNFISIVITPTSRPSVDTTPISTSDESSRKKQAFYKVQLMSKPGFPRVSLANETAIISLDALPTFVRQLALNASTASCMWHAREDGEYISHWTARLREIKLLPRKGLTSFLKALPGPPLREPDEAPPRTDGSEEHILLRVYDGFACRSCAFRTISIQSMRRHLSDSAGRQWPAHGTAQNRPAIEALYDGKLPPKIPVDESFIDQAKSAVGELHVSFGDLWLKGLRSGTMDAFTKESQLFGMILRSRLANAPDQSTKPFFQCLRDIIFIHKVDNVQGVHNKIINNTSDVLPLFYCSSLEQISVSITLTSLSLGTIREGCLGHVLKTTKSLTSLRWKWLFDPNTQDEYNTPVINFEKALEAPQVFLLGNIQYLAISDDLTLLDEMEGYDRDLLNAMRVMRLELKDLCIAAGVELDIFKPLPDR
ncbi:GTPase activating protein [Purpureocillium lavendulum]|uniref:GTPase activating protein n=1 Tax=Purpureocillium lavendulum TaxID=1247861 RepID=A0AB34FKP0_9HYPO|nr:GTPase activating protein [Purpureocillium lavendulum]